LREVYWEKTIRRWGEFYLWLKPLAIIFVRAGRLLSSSTPSGALSVSVAW
jgi:hypothetical protein